MTAAEDVDARLDRAVAVGRHERRSMLANREQAADSWRRADMEEIEREREGGGSSSRC